MFSRRSRVYEGAVLDCRKEQDFSSGFNGFFVKTISEAADYINEPERAVGLNLSCKRDHALRFDPARRFGVTGERPVQYDRPIVWQRNSVTFLFPLSK